MSTILHELTSLMQQPLISPWATLPLRLDQDASKICAIIPPSLGPVQPQELTIETTDAPDRQIVGANGIPRRCMCLP
jgi:hypothetical protein